MLSYCIVDLFVNHAFGAAGLISRLARASPSPWLVTYARSMLLAPPPATTHYPSKFPPAAKEAS